MRLQFATRNISTFLLFFVCVCFTLDLCLADLLSEPAQPLNPGDYPTPNTVPAFPVQIEAPSFPLDLSAELFGGVKDACGLNLDRSRCCLVLAAWLFAKHARSEVTVPAAAPPASFDAPTIPQPNTSCDAVLCFCGIRLHQIRSLSCPTAFNLTAHRNATPSTSVKNLERSCRNSSYAGCTRCPGALQKLKGGQAKNGTQAKEEEDESSSDRGSKMFGRDCQLMGLTWLLARNKTVYIPTVSAALRVLMYSIHCGGWFVCRMITWRRMQRTDSEGRMRRRTCVIRDSIDLRVILEILDTYVEAQQFGARLD